MTLNSRDVIEMVASHAMSTGQFERVNQHESKNSPGNGLYCDVTVLQGQALALASGLSVTSALLVMSVVLYVNAQQEPLDDIDGCLMDALDDLLQKYNGDFTLDGLIRNVDILGSHGAPLQWTMGHMDRSGGMIRAAEIVLPLVISDAWEQEA